MNSRWDDSAARDLSDLDLLVYASRLIGAETSLVVWGGGNTSLKRVERDHRGREVRVLWVKGSGSDLATRGRRRSMPASGGTGRHCPTTRSLRIMPASGPS